MDMKNQNGNDDTESSRQGVSLMMRTTTESGTYGVFAEPLPLRKRKATKTMERDSNFSDFRYS